MLKSKRFIEYKGVNFVQKMKLIAKKAIYTIQVLKEGETN